MNSRPSISSHNDVTIETFAQNTRPLLIVSGFMREYQITIGYSLDKSLSTVLNYYIIMFYRSTYKMYGIGRQESGEFGFGKHVSQKDGFVRLKQFEKFLYLVSSPFNIFRGKERLQILSDNRKLYSAGFNERGECGVNSTRYKITNLTPCTFENINNVFINLVSDGIWSNHTICRLSTGQFCAFGINHHAEFGDNFQSYAFQNFPIKLPYLTNFFKAINIIKIATGFEHTLFLTSSGVLYSCGNNDIGQCGIRQDPDNNCHRYKQQISPQMIVLCDKSEECVFDMSCGEDFNLVLTAKNEIYVFGNNINGQLGMGVSSVRVYKTPMLHSVFNSKNHDNAKGGKIVQIECGRIHSCVVNDNGIAFLFGYNGYGQIGNGKVNDWNDGIKQPHCFQTMHKNYSNLKIKQVALGSDHTVLLTQLNNRIITFGGNEHRQCAPNDKSSKILFPHFLQYDEIGLKYAQPYQTIIAGTKTTVVILYADA